jgi:hypothetical protein
VGRLTRALRLCIRPRTSSDEDAGLPPACGTTIRWGFVRLQGLVPRLMPILESRAMFIRCRVRQSTTQSTTGLSADSTCYAPLELLLRQVAPYTWP